jgi:hypothetical protein
MVLNGKALGYEHEFVSILQNRDGIFLIAGKQIK